MANSHDEFKEKLIKFIDENNGNLIDMSCASENDISKIAERFVEHKRTNIRAITSLKKFVSYTVAAKIVGDRDLIYNIEEYLNDEIGYSRCNIYLKMFDDIEVQDNCYDDFKTTIDRNIYRINKDYYEYLKDNNLKYVIKDRSRFGSNAITLYISSYNIEVYIHDSATPNDLKKYESLDKDTITYSFCKDPTFIYKGGKLYNIHDNIELKLDIDDIPSIEVIEYLVGDSKIIYKDGSLESCAGGLGCIRTRRLVTLDSLEGKEVAITSNNVYFNEDDQFYIIGGNNKLEIRYYHIIQDYDILRLVVPYAALGGKYVETYSLSKLEQIEGSHPYMDGEDLPVRQNMIYLVKGRTIISKVKYNGGYGRNITFDYIKELLDRAELF